MKKGKLDPYDIIIIIFIIAIIIVGISFFTSEEKVEVVDNKEPEQETPTPTQPSNLPSSVLTINLKGDKQMTVIKGQTYQEPGYSAYDSKEGDLTDKVIIEGSVNTNEVGSYTLTYRVTNSYTVKNEKTRIVKVIDDLDVKIDYSPKELTKDAVTVSIRVTGDCLESIQDPLGNISKYKQQDYKISANGDYKFIIKRTDGTTIEKTIKIENIDKTKPTGSCKSTITNDKTTIVVTANDENGINKYVYGFNNKTKESTTNKYEVNEVAKTVTVTIYDKVGNTKKITCNTIDDSWPVISNPNYQNHSAKNYKSLRYEGRMNYLIYYPDNMSLSEKHPLVIHLHGIGEFGTNISNTLAGSSAFANGMRQGMFQQQAIFLAPQCAAGSKRWTACFSDLKGLIDKVVKEYNVDPNRISMAGHSLGGQAVFDFIATYPGFLAAAAPLSPSYPWNHDYSKMKDLKIAVFIGTKEGLYTKDQPEIQYLQQNGVNLKFYPLEGVTHSSQKAFYWGTNIIDWLISQSK